MAFTTIVEKQQILDTKSAFWYSGEGFEATRLAAEHLFAQYDHAVATTSDFTMCHRLPPMEDDQKIDWVEKMVGKSGVLWLRTARTAPGAGFINESLEATLDFWSGQVPLQEMEGFVVRDGASTAAPLHAVNLGGACWGCGQHGHRAADCPCGPQ